MKKLSIFFILILLAACASKPPVPYEAEKNEGQWEAKAQLRDFEKGTTNNLSLEVMAYRDQALRMEVTGPLGVHVASVLLKGSDIKYAAHTQKRFFSGPVSESSLRPILRADLDPRWLYGVFFDEPLNGWKCEGDPIEKCEKANLATILWSERNGEKKRITIKNPKFELQILVKDFTTKVQSPERIFSLESPENYKRYKLQ